MRKLTESTLQVPSKSRSVIRRTQPYPTNATEQNTLRQTKDVSDGRNFNNVTLNRKRRDHSAKSNEENDPCAMEIVSLPAEAKTPSYCSRGVQTIRERKREYIILRCQWRLNNRIQDVNSRNWTTTLAWIIGCGLHLLHLSLRMKRRYPEVSWDARDTWEDEKNELVSRHQLVHNMLPLICYSPYTPNFASSLGRLLKAA